MPTDNKTASRIPEDCNGLQYNFCKNPSCSQFGLSASQEKTYGGNTYNLTGKTNGSTNIPLLRCNACNETFPMKSNEGIQEEIERLKSYLDIANLITCCPEPSCKNHSVSVETPKAYRKDGKTNAGSQRYVCKECNLRFAVNAKPTAGQHETHHNIDIFKLLMNKMPLNRIVHVLDISWDVLYHRIDFLHKQCLAFASKRENKLWDMEFKRLYLSVDRQEYAVNWTERKDKRNVMITAVASACNKTGYVFGIHPNFDPSIDKKAVEIDAQVIQDSKQTPPFRKYARLWLENDYVESSLRIRYKKGKAPSSSLSKTIDNTYEASYQRPDVEAFDEKGVEEKLPTFGAQTHAEYTMIAHFHFLKELFGNVEKWRFFLDQDSGIRSACFSSFVDEIQSRDAEAFYVSIEKGLTVDQKRKLKKESQKKFAEIKNANPGLGNHDIKIKMLSDEINAMQVIGKYKDRWVKHPLPDMSESNKQMCWLTEHNDFDLNHKASLYNLATLHGVDCFFQKIRRRIAMLERPIHSSSNAGRTWNGYGAYNPEMVGKLLDIFRVVHNYIDFSKEKVKDANGNESTVKITPAMQMGLASAPMEYKDVIYFEA